jgi:hypothetical protein
MKRFSKYKSTLVGLMVLTGSWVPAAWWATAEAMSSTNYVIPSDTMSIGGSASGSGSFWAEDTIGEGLSGENLTSASYRACIGFQCVAGTAPFLSFSVKTGTASPGSDGGSVDLGALDTVSVKTSGGTINSVFLTAESNASGGVVISVKDSNGGLASASVPTDKINSQTATLSAGSAGFGVCVYAATQGSGSPSTLSKAAPYNGDCNKTNAHAVGAVSQAPATVLSSGGVLTEGTAEVLVKASVSPTATAHNDYTDSLTFIITASY